MDCDNGKVGEKENLLAGEEAIPLSTFDGSCYGSPDKQIPPQSISKEEMERF